MSFKTEQGRGCKRKNIGKIKCFRKPVKPLLFGFYPKQEGFFVSVTIIAKITLCMLRLLTIIIDKIRLVKISRTNRVLADNTVQCKIFCLTFFWKTAAKAFSCSSESRVAPRNLRLWHLWCRFLYWISKSHLTISDQRRNTLKRKSAFWSLFRLLARDQAAICNRHWKRL